MVDILQDLDGIPDEGNAPDDSQHVLRRSTVAAPVPSVSHHRHKRAHGTDPYAAIDPTSTSS
jgi:hypothetical protein